MKPRRDGMQTRRRLLEAACRVFAEKGFHAARVADICRRARTNVAAVNYHFGGKAALYVEAWRHAFSLAKPSVAQIPEDWPPEKRLRAFVEDLLRNLLDTEANRPFSRLYLMELIHPTGLVTHLWRELIEPRRRVLLRILADLLHTDPDDPRVLLCDLSVIGQCRAPYLMQTADLEYLLRSPLSPHMVRRLVDHITRFSLAGIRGMAAETAQERSPGGLSRPPSTGPFSGQDP
ncbi:TetR/AcrR family transcriptional regulator [Desulfacinum hydrothermale]|nr:CerR family C-terminal domain-containing protein [Desulfacinum hydrothermale]